MSKKIVNNKNNNRIDNCFNYIISYIKLNEDNSSYNNPYYKEIPFYIEDNFLISEITKLKINLEHNIKNDKLNYRDVVFIPKFNEMLNLIFFGICTGTPLIFEGYSGQGKQTAINYICNILNYEIENIIITKNFTYKDLYKKSIVQKYGNGEIELVDIHTKLYEKLNKSSQNKILFVFHNIHLAESDVLSELSQIFNKRGNETYSFIGIINNKESIIERDLYYYNYFYNSFYYIINLSKEEEISYVEKFISYYLKDVKSSIINYYKKQDNNLTSNKLTLSNIIKFKELKDIISLDNEFLEEIIFLNNSEDKFIKKDYELDINYTSTNLIIEVRDKSFIIQKIPRYNKLDEEVNTLSFDQKKCLIFLSLVIQSKRACIIQGKSGVGKSHLIKLFAKIFNKNLHVFEVNKDNDISLLTKSCNFKNYNQKEKNEIELIFDEIMNKNNISNNNLDFQKKYEKICDIKNLDKVSKVQLDELKIKYKFINRFKYENSEFLDAVEKGEWILLDGIENVSSSVLEKLILLCGENPELNLYDKDTEKIIPKEGFHLFMTYNPERINQNVKLPNALTDKCYIYYLKSFLDDEASMSEIIYGFLVNLDFNRVEENLKNISKRLSKLFKILKEETNKETEKISEISERTFINFLKSLNYDENISKLALNIKNNYLYFCFPSFDKKKYLNIINNNIANEIMDFDFKPLAKSYSINCIRLINVLYDFEEKIDTKSNYELDFSDFIDSCLEIPFKYIYKLIDNIEKSTKKAEKNNFEGIYRPLYIFLNYFNELKKDYENVNENKTYKKKLDECAFPKIIILKLFKNLINENYFCGECIDLLYDTIKNDILESILNLFREKTMNNLILFIKLIICNKKYLKDILKIFPYLAFKNTKFQLLNNIFKYILYSLDNNINIKFIIKINNEEFEFTQSDKIKIILDLNINNNKNLIITKNSFIYFQSLELDNKIEYIFKNLENQEKITDFIFNIIIKIFKYKNHTDIEEKISKDLEENSFQIDYEFKNINEKEEYSYFFNRFFKRKNNLITYIWSLLFLDNKIINEKYIYLFCQDTFNIEINIFQICFNLYKNLISSKDYLNEIGKIINVNKELQNLIQNINILYSLSFNRNYLRRFISMEEKKNIKENIKKELEIINKLKDSNIKEKFLQYSNLLSEELEKINQEEILYFKNIIL